MQLSNINKAALKLLLDNSGRIESRPAAIGETLFCEPSKNSAYHRSRQGLALAGGKVMRNLQRMGLITISSNKFDTIYALTELGRKTCKQESL